MRFIVSKGDFEEEIMYPIGDFVRKWKKDLQFVVPK